MAFRKYYLLPVCLMLISVSLFAQTPLQLKHIDSLMLTASNRGVFNGTLLVARHGKVIYDKAWGYANAGKTQMLTTAMLFDIGSISKEFNGVSIMLLKERGKIKLDDPVSKYLTDLPDWAGKVQIRNLINYTSGLPNFKAQSDETDHELLDSLKSLTKLKFEPGSAYIYAHANVYLQKRIIEKVSGLSYTDFVNKYIFRPCGMKHSIMDADLNRPDIARAFDNDFNATPYIQLTTGFPRLTSADLYTFITRLEALKIISKESFDQLAVNFPGGESSLGTTGFKDGELQWHRHQGSNSNYEALIYTDHVQDISMVMETNNQNFKVDAIKGAILAILQDQPFNIPKKSVYLDIRDKMVKNMEQGLAFYRHIKAEGREQYDFEFEAGDLISTGKYLQRRSRFDDAISLYALASPLCARKADLSYVDELTAECYLKKGDHVQAKAWYEKALVADAGNKNAKGMITTLK
ncbi:CubicO group peptidase (beta-lactamase class C family) [Pedobacter cryoconitis]|uniref:CubicO group peptidase (Beta-lactamase class C family) n=1 Tax=Pedobacter cryoconitis TaxID=188932 RepID=A0A7W8ZQV6_9SPHI|nr:serine hydrolase [Pedobacter cryoconitis]MBB5638300.1 CubicO group peptidase (beta-lactamase class C family) [Pedobacter cryoconitis]